VKQQQDEAKYGKAHTLFDFSIKKSPAYSSDFSTQSGLGPSPIMAISLRDVLMPDPCNGLSSHSDTVQRGTSSPLSIINVDADEDEASPELIKDLHISKTTCSGIDHSQVTSWNQDVRTQSSVGGFMCLFP
jgi:hypothetical protein